MLGALGSIELAIIGGAVGLWVLQASMVAWVAGEKGRSQFR